MKKENLVLIAEGQKLIAIAYAQEAGLDVDFFLAQNPENKEQADAPEKAPTPKTGKVTPKVKPEPEVQADAEEEADADTNEEDGYSLEELNGMTIKQLKEIAKENGIHVPKDTKKSDIIDLIMDGAEEPTDETDSEEDVDASDEGEELTIADVEEMDLKSLKALAKEYEVDLPAKVTKEEAIKTIVDSLFDEEDIEAYYELSEGDESEADEDEEGTITEADLAEMSLTELKELAKEYEIEHPKVIKADKLRAILAEALFSEDDDEDEDSDETGLDADDKAEEYGLNEMSVEELTDLLVEHEIKAKGNKQALIAKVLEAIEEGVIEVDEEEGE